MSLNIKGFNFNKVIFFKAINRCLYQIYIDGLYHDDNDKGKDLNKVKNHYNNYYKNLKKELILNPALHFVTLFQSTNYKYPVLNNLAEGGSGDPLTTVQNYYFDYDVIYPKENINTVSYTKELKNAKLHQMIHPEVYFIIYSLINFGIIGISYAIYRSKIKRNQF